MNRLVLPAEQAVAISLHSDQPARSGSDLPIFWLGEVVYAAVSRQVENFYDSLHKVMRRWSTDFMVRRLLGFMVILNPRLNKRQQTHLTPILSRAMDQLIWERSLDTRVLRGIVALACPNQDTALLFGYLMEVVAGLAQNPFQQDEISDHSMASDVESPPPIAAVDTYVEEVKVAQTLTRFYSVEPIYVAAMPLPIKKAVLGALNGGLDVIVNPSGLLVSNQQSPPVCCITLEPLVLPDGTVTDDVVAVIQRSQTTGKTHAFLYRGRALFDWLAHSQIPTNPDTRSLVRPTDIYRLS
ncbi:hypothetical protein R1sor_022501 [Riccia sorocarpa]|uniref:Uncharacterized protein n=1 Tax=Riccia sorocarpa TaxID=122646 RepID=A0ABD3GK07_9MARC